MRSGRVGPEDVTVADLLDRWMEQIESKGRSQNTLYGYRRYIDREILPVLGSTRLSKLTTLNIDRFYNSLVDRGLAAGTVRQAHAILRASLNQAEKWGLVGRNVAKLASPPAQPQREQHPPTIDQVRRLLETATETDPTFAAYVRLVAATGMRRAEACAIRWGDLDLEGGTLEVSRSHVAVPGFRDDQSTKTRSTRTVAIDDATISMLTAIKAVRPESLDAPDSYVFTNDGERPWRPDYASTRWDFDSSADRHNVTVGPTESWDAREPTGDRDMVFHNDKTRSVAHDLVTTAEGRSNGRTNRESHEIPQTEHTGECLCCARPYRGRLR